MTEGFPDGAGLTGRVLEGRRAVITGAGSGIGAGIAAAFAAAGADLHLIGSPRNPAAVEELATRLRGETGVRISTSNVDVRDDAAVAAAMADATAHLGGIDCLVTSAGMSAPTGVTAQTPIHALTTAQFQEIMDVNVRGTWSAIRHAIGELVKAPNVSSVITLGSVASKRPTHGGYSVSKSAVWMLTRVLALDYAPHGVRFNCLAPGFIDTPLFRAVAEQERPGDADAVVAARAARVPLGRIGTVAEVAATALFLAGPHSSYLTGCLVHPDGGLINANAGG